MLTTEPATAQASDLSRSALAELEERAAEAARMLGLMANENRLRILCALAGGETSVGELVDAIGLSQSAMSQHLARLRADGLVAFRRDGTTLLYRVEDVRAVTLLGVLRDIYCCT